MFKSMSVMMLTVAVFGVATSAQAAWTTVAGRSYGPYCPNHVGGDREYNGHGPDVNSTITLYRNNANRDVRLSFYMDQIETTSDWSHATLNRDVRIAIAPVNTSYTQVWMPLGGTWQWVNLGGASTIDTVDVTYVDNDHAADVFSNPDWFVSSVRIVGDTGGNDIGNCTTDDASFTATIPTLYFWYQ